MANIQLFFSVQGTGGSPTGPRSGENRVGDQDIGSPSRTPKKIIVMYFDI